MSARSNTCGPAACLLVFAWLAASLLGCESQRESSNPPPVTSATRDCSEPCRARGRCTAQHGRCVSTRDSDCKKSSACFASGHCDLLDGPCGPGNEETSCKACRIGGDASCRRSRMCKRAGACTARLSSSLPPFGLCVVKSDADCAASENCATSGLCRMEDLGGITRCAPVPDAGAPKPSRPDAG